MESILFVSNQQISTAQLQDAVREMGGSWDADPTLQQGVVFRNGVSLYLNAPMVPSVEYDDEEIKTMTKQLGAKPQTIICIDIGHGEGAFDFANIIGTELVRRWGGIIDDNGICDEHY